MTQRVFLLLWQFLPLLIDATRPDRRTSVGLLGTRRSRKSTTLLQKDSVQKDAGEQTAIRQETAARVDQITSQLGTLTRHVKAVGERVLDMQYNTEAAMTEVRTLESVLAQRNATAVEVGELITQASKSSAALQEKSFVAHEKNLTTLTEIRVQELEPLAKKKLQFEDFQMQVGDAQQSVDALQPEMQRARALVDDLTWETRNVTETVRDETREVLSRHLMDTNYYYRENLRAATGPRKST